MAMLFFSKRIIASPIFFHQTYTQVLSPISTDDHIIQLIKNLDKQSISAILEQYGDSLYGLAYHKLKSENLATEVIQQTFIIVWQQLSNFDEQQEHVFNWVLRIMNGIIADNHYQQAA